MHIYLRRVIFQNMISELSIGIATPVFLLTLNALRKIALHMYVYVYVYVNALVYAYTNIYMYMTI